jgi:hypothetical protein
MSDIERKSAELSAFVAGAVGLLTGTVGTVAIKAAFAYPVHGTSCGSSADDSVSLGEILGDESRCNIFGKPVVYIDDMTTLVIGVFIALVVSVIAFFVIATN